MAIPGQKSVARIKDIAHKLHKLLRDVSSRAGYYSGSDMNISRELYTNLIGRLLEGREDFDCPIPTLIDRHRTLEGYIDALGRSLKGASDLIDRDFRELFAWLDKEMVGAEETLPNGISTKVASAAWTGNRTVSEIAISVKHMVPVAQHALEILITEQERRLHNQPPAPVEFETLDHLRRLHAELTELLRAVDRGQNLSNRLKEVAAAANGVFKVDERLGITIRGLEVVGLSLVPTFAAVKALEYLFGQSFDVAGEATVSAAMLAITHLSIPREEKQ